MTDTVQRVDSIRTGQMTYRSLRICMVLGTAMLLIVGCDTSENPNLLNPTLTDSAAVRVLNLSDVTLSSVSLGGNAIGEDVPPGFASASVPVWLFERTILTIGSSGSVDTVRNVRPATSVDDPLLATWIVYPVADSLTAVQVVAGTVETELLQTAGEARVYFFNGVRDRTLLVREGCASGEVAFSETTGNLLAGSNTLRSGTYSFYLFEETSELTTARLDLTPGSVIAIVAQPDGSGGVELRTINMAPGSGVSGTSLEPLPPEDRSTGDLTIINGLVERSIDVRLIGTDATVTSALAPGQVSSTVTLEVCQTPDGDSLEIVTSTGDTTRLPFSTSVGSSTRIVVYDDGSGVRALTLAPQEGAGSESVQLRAVSLASPGTPVNVIVGAGAPGSMQKGSLLFPALRTGQLSPYRIVDPGLYPLGIEYSSSGFFISGGLERLTPGRYTLLVLESSDGPILRLLDESAASTEVRQLTTQGVRSVVFSGTPGRVVTFRIGLAVGELTIPDVAYSYVFPTVLPEETVSVNVDGETSSVKIGSSGTLIGFTGVEEGPRELITIDRLDARPPSGEVALRFLNGVPGSVRLAARSDSALGPVITTFSYPTPSEILNLDARRHTFMITPDGQNELLARVSSVQLSEERAYVLVVVPVGPTSTTGLEYSTIFLQE